MKYFILFISMLFILPVYGQRKKSKKRSKKSEKSEKFIHVRGGYLLDYGDGNNRISYDGFNILNLGWSKANGKMLQSFEVELLGFESGFIIKTPPMGNLSFADTGLDRQKRSLELIYSRLYTIGESDVTNTFSIGPTGSLLFNEDSIDPVIISSFPITNYCFCIGIGARANYNWRVSNRFMLSFSTRVTLLDFGWQRQRIDNPILTQRQRVMESGFGADFLRSQFQFMLGLNFRI